MNDKPHRMRIRAVDGKPRNYKELQGKANHLRVIDDGQRIEFVVCADMPDHLAAFRDLLGPLGMQEISGNLDVQVNFQKPTRPTAPSRTHTVPGNRPSPSHHMPAGTGNGEGRAAEKVPLKPKPYAFQPLPEHFQTAKPVWHDGSSSGQRLSGEIRFELTAITPLLVGWERSEVALAAMPKASPQSDTDARARFLQRAAEEQHPIDDRLKPHQIRRREQERAKYVEDKAARLVDLADVGLVTQDKPVLCPLRLPLGKREVLIPGDSIKGLLRHELGALFGAPMERVAERSYSYRPNSKFPNVDSAVLRPRLARIPQDPSAVACQDIGGAREIRVPTRLELFPLELTYDKHGDFARNFYRFPKNNAAVASYRGGQGAGKPLNSKAHLHNTIDLDSRASVTPTSVPLGLQQGYVATIRHLIDPTTGHFSSRYPNRDVSGAAQERVLKAAQTVVFQPGDYIWVEWDTQARTITSFGWHYYYHWAYADTVHRQGGQNRPGLFPLPEELLSDADGAPQNLSHVRRLFGYTGDNPGSADIGGKGEHMQLMGRLSVNNALEVLAPGASEEQRFLAPVFLKELGQPRPSAVEHYLKQRYHPNQRPSDGASLETYGDLPGRDKGGDLAGRKFYLDRATGKRPEEAWQDESPANRCNERSTLAFEASRPKTQFRFTLRFQNLDPSELAAVLVALCPNQFKQELGGKPTLNYVSKLGYARPLGWGTVQCQADGVYLLSDKPDGASLNPIEDLQHWVGRHLNLDTALRDSWLALHQQGHPDAADYPRSTKTNQVFSYHTELRAEHTQLRRNPRRQQR